MKATLLDKSLTAEVVPTGSKENFTNLLLGTITLAQAGSGNFELQPETINGKSLMNLSSVTIRRR